MVSTSPTTVFYGFNLIQNNRFTVTICQPTVFSMCLSRKFLFAIKKDKYKDDTFLITSSTIRLDDNDDDDYNNDDILQWKI